LAFLRPDFADPGFFAAAQGKVEQSKNLQLLRLFDCFLPASDCF